MRVGVLPMGAVPRDLLVWLSDHLAKYGIVCDVFHEAPSPDGAFVEAKRKWDADAILRGLAASPRDSTVLAITSKDLFSGAYNFVFGLADGTERLAVVSLFRLTGEGDQRLRERLLKEAVHELGHTLGRSHCPNSDCVMHFSNSLADTDAKTGRFCDGCARSLPISPHPRS